MTIEEEHKFISQAQADPEVFGRIFDVYYSKIFKLLPAPAQTSRRLKI